MAEMPIALHMTAEQPREGGRREEGREGGRGGRGGGGGVSG
jgi:hypothetical protein